MDKIRALLRYVVALVLAAVLLQGCMLASGEQTSTDNQNTAGNISTSFVSAEGQDDRVIDVGAATQLRVITSVSVAQGDLRIDVLDPQGSVVLSVAGRPNEQVTKLGTIVTDSEGKLHYRVVARGARDGSYQVLYQKAGA